MEEVELIHRLPDDMVAAVLCRLSPSTLAAARCVCKRWCSIVDGRCLLRARTDLLLPLRLDGIFCNYDPDNLCEPRPCFFARPSTARRIAGDLNFFIVNGHRKNTDRQIMDHCNGLLLLGWDMAVVNPATRQWATLPPYPEPLLTLQLSTPPAVEDEALFPRFYLAYDPMAVSPHRFEVFLIPDLMLDYKCNYDSQSEWPTSPYRAHVFSSTTWVWEKRSFVRQGEPVGTIDDAATDDDDRHSVYFQGALYVHWQNNSIMRVACLSNNDNKYQMIKSPLIGSKLGEHNYSYSYLGKSEKGVYSALLYRDGASCPHFRVWLLNVDTMEWVLRSDINLLQVLVRAFGFFDFDNRYNKPWILANYSGRSTTPLAEKDNELIEFDNNEWDFDNGGFVLETIDDEAKSQWPYYIEFLGFHPYKEVALFWSKSNVLCYQLKTSRVHELGVLCVPFINKKLSSFLYTPCWMQMEPLFTRHN